MSSESPPRTDGVSVRRTDRSHARPRAQWLATLALVSTLPGCSGPDDPWTRAPASGTVTLDGAPLIEGTITFFPSGSTKGPAAGGPIIDGRYDIPTAEGPVVGTHRVEIRSVQKTGRLVKSPVAVETSGPPIDMVEETKEVVPPQYNRDSSLEFKIEADSENINNITMETDYPDTLGEK